MTILCVVGLILITKPPFLFQLFGEEAEALEASENRFTGWIALLASSFLVGLSIVVLRALAAKTDPFITTFVNGAVTVGGCGIGMMMTGGDQIPNSE